MPSINTAFQVPLPAQQQALPFASSDGGSFVAAYEGAQKQKDPLYKLKMAELEQNLTLQSLKISEALRERQDLIDAEKAAQGAAPGIKSMLNDPYAAHQAMTAATVDNPMLTKSSTWQNLGGMVKTSLDMKNILDDNARLKAADDAERNFVPTVETVKDEDGKTVKVLRRSPNAVQLIPEGMAPGDLKAVPVKDEKGNVITYALPGATGPRYVAPKGPTLGVATKEEIKSIYKQIERLQEQYDGMKDKTFFGNPNTQKIELGKRIDDLKQKAKASEGVTSPPTPSAPSTQVAYPELKLGGIYEDGQGNKAIYQGGDANDPNSWKPVPK